MNVMDFKSQGVLIAIETIKKLGLPIPSEEIPTELKELEFPVNIGDITDTDLAKHMSGWTDLISRVEFHVAMVSSSLEAVDETIKMLVRKRLISSTDDVKTPVTVREAEAYSDPDIQKKVVLRSHLRAMEKMLKAVLKGYSDKLFAVSREQTRREKCVWGTGSFYPNDRGERR
jgi:hypothetical protein